jgi:hypothetical protein
MKRVKVLWFIFVFLIFVAGFALGMSHNKPRLLLDARLLDTFLEGQVTVPPTPPPPPGKRYKIVKDKFDKYQKKDENIYTEEWTTKMTGAAGPVSVYLVYDVSSETVTIVKK